MTLDASDGAGVVGYYFSENSSTPTAPDAGWVNVDSTADYIDTFSYTLSDPTGIVYAWFKDAADNISIAISYDYHPPVGQEAYIKAVNANAIDRFGKVVSLYGDTLVVGAADEDSSQVTITNGTGARSDNAWDSAGAANVFLK